MPTTVTMLSLIRGSAEQLLPQELHDFVAKIVANPDDMAIPLVVADWLKEQDEPELEYAFRWMAKHKSHPVRNEPNNKFNWYIQQFIADKTPQELPWYMYNEMTADEVGVWSRRELKTYLAAVAWLAVELDELKKHLQVEGM